MTRQRSGVVLVTALSAVFAIGLRGEDKPEKPRYTLRKFHDPNGIGKFYMGREIAHVISGTQYFERPEREKEEKLSVLVTSLELKPGMVVADVGAGTGVISSLMAEKVGPKGYVIAVDVQQKMLDRLKKRMAKIGIKNVRPHKGSAKTPNLKPGSVDLVLMVDVYHEFAYPYEMLLEISKALKPGGRVAFVEYRMEDPSVRIKKVHKMSQAQVKKEVGQPEFRLSYVKTIGVLPRQHILVFSKQKPGRGAKSGARKNRSENGSER